MSAFYSCYPWPIGGCCRVLVMLHLKGAHCIWTFYTCPNTLLTAVLRIAFVSLCVLICFVVIELHLGHPFSSSEYLHREHLCILAQPAMAHARVSCALTHVLRLQALIVQPSQVADVLAQRDALCHHAKTDGRPAILYGAAPVLGPVLSTRPPRCVPPPPPNSRPL